MDDWSSGSFSRRKLSWYESTNERKGSVANLL